MVDSTNFAHNTTEVKTQPKNFYNPFNPTARDYERTQKLAAKNLAAVIIGGFFLSPIASSLYLGRAANLLKIYVYMFIASMTIILTVVPNEAEAKKVGQSIGYVTSLVAAAEQVNAVKQARKRQSETK